jgi:alpha-D-xyloside xylohydrolase
MSPDPASGNGTPEAVSVQIWPGWQSLSPHANASPPSEHVASQAHSPSLHWALHWQFGRQWHGGGGPPHFGGGGGQSPSQTQAPWTQIWRTGHSLLQNPPTCPSVHTPPDDELLDELDPLLEPPEELLDVEGPVSGATEPPHAPRRRTATANAGRATMGVGHSMLRAAPLYPEIPSHLRSDAVPSDTPLGSPRRDVVGSRPMRRPLFLLLALGACTSTPARVPDDAPLYDGTYSVMFHGAPRALVLARQSDTLLTFPADGLALGVADMVNDTVDYDPYPDGVPLSNPDGLRWLSVVDARLVARDAASVTVTLLYEEGKQAQLHLEETALGSFEAKLIPDAAGPPVALFRLRAQVDAHEGFYGLGEYFDDVNHRGHVRAMQLEPNGGVTESGYNEAHVPVPFVIGTRGWGLFVETRYPALFDVAAKDAQTIEATIGTGTASNDGLVFHLFAADHPLDITKRYYDVTAKPLLPARWALGPWLWRNHADNQAQVENDAQTMRDLDLAHTAMWIDHPYDSAVGAFDFSAKFTNPAAMIEKVHGLGFRMALWHTPYVDEKAPTTQALKEEAIAKGYYPPTTSVLLNPWGRPIDLTNPDAFKWWQGHLRSYTDLGIEGFKLDYGEDIAPTVGTGRNIWRFFDGSDERTMHAAYTLFHHRAYAGAVSASGGFLLCRHGTWGDQANVSVMWPGDLDATFAKHAEPAQGYISVGGLPASIIAGLSLGPSGFPFYGSDTGGYRHSPPDKEIFTRWFEQTSLSTVMQIGNSASTVAWDKDPATGFDDEMLGWYRTYTRLHLRLFPYVWTLAQALAQDGRPITRALGLAYPDLGVHPNDTYMFGDDLLVAPVVARGARTREIVFPPGDWIDWWTGAVQTGGRTDTVGAPLEKLPLYLRRGGMVPLLRPTIDGMAPASDPTVDTYARTAGVLYVRVGTGVDVDRVLYDGAHLSAHFSPRTATLASAPGTELTSGAIFELLGAPPATAVHLDGALAASFPSVAELEGSPGGWTVEGGTTFVKIPPGPHSADVTY